jgi:hypothetical protein
MTDVIATAAEAVEADALPRARVVHCDPAVESAEQDPLPEAVTKTPVSQKSPAEWAYQRMILYIQNFEKHLDVDHEVAMGFTGGDAGVLRIEGMGFFEPDLLTFYGTDQSGARTQMIQHVSQLTVLLRALPKVSGAKTANRIGFRLAADLEGPPPQT